MMIRYKKKHKSKFMFFFDVWKLLIIFVKNYMKSFNSLTLSLDTVL